jgi:phage terminase large subunit-like protein
MTARPYHDIARTYATEVVNGHILACKLVKLACKRFLADLLNSTQINPQWVFDQAKADRPCRFIEALTHTKEWFGASRDFAIKPELIVLQPWQIFILQNVFGFLDPKTGFRRFNAAMTVCPRKNGKSLFSAAVGNYMLVADGEVGSEVYCGATTEKQAWEVFMPAKLQIQNNKPLQQHFGVKVNAKSLSVARDGSKFMPLIGNPGDGSSPHMAILDERHEHLDNRMYDAMRTGMGARKQPLLWTVTTAGFDLSSPCYDDVMTGRKVLEGTLKSDRLFYIEYTIDTDDDWTSIEAARKASPNFGVSVNEDFIKGELQDAINIASKQNAYKTKYLCVWAQAKNAFHNLQRWNANYKPNLKLDDFKGQTIILGCDFAAKQDVCSTAILIPQNDGTFVTFSQNYLPSEAVHAPGRNHYVAWEAEHKIEVYDGNMNDFDSIELDIDQLVHDFDVQKIVIDARLASMMEQHLIGKGYPVEAFVPSAVNYTEPMRFVDGLINDGKLHHNASPNDPMSWMIANVTSKTNKRDMDFPDKERIDNKIDYAVALYMAAAEYLETPVSTLTSLFMS